MHGLIKFAAGALLFYLGYCALLFLLQRHILFPRYQIPAPVEMAQHFPGFEKIWLDTEFGKIETWFLPPVSSPSGMAPAVIFAHGNAELIDFWPQALKKFTEMGVGLLLVEYPGYGRSGGSPSQDSITHTFVAAYDALVSKKSVDPSRIVFFGRSVGGGAICTLAAQRPSAALILMSTFTSARSFASKFLVPPFLVRDPFDNLAVVKAYNKPILTIHGKYDRIIPYSHALKLQRAAPNSKLIAYDADHNDCPPDWRIFWQDIELFLIDSGII